MSIIIFSHASVIPSEIMGLYPITFYVEFSAFIHDTTMASERWFKIFWFFAPTNNMHFGINQKRVSKICFNRVRLKMDCVSFKIISCAEGNLQNDSCWFSMAFPMSLVLSPLQICLLQISNRMLWMILWG